MSVAYRARLGRMAPPLAGATLRDLRAPMASVLLVLALVMLAPVVIGHDPLTQHLANSLDPPSPQAWFGTDRYGRDVFARVIAGTRTSVLAALVVVGVCFTTGLLMGAVAAIAPPFVKPALSGLIDLGLGIPGIVVGIAVIGALGTGTLNITIALCVFGWCWYARMAQEQAQEILDGEVIGVARVAGVSGWHQITGHVLPHVARRLLVVACLDVGYVILMIAALGYLGLGAQEPQPELGQMLRDGQQFVLDAPWLIIAPVIAILLVVLPFAAAGERVQSRLVRA